jgi:transcriptional regulator with XRE-family HTH domain
MLPLSLVCHPWLTTPLHADHAKLFGGNLRRLRLKAGWSQESLATECGLYRTYLSRLENGIVNPTLSVIVTLAYQLRVAPYKLLQA